MRGVKEEKRDPIRLVERIDGEDIKVVRMRVKVNLIVYSQGVLEMLEERGEMREDKSEEEGMIMVMKMREEMRKGTKEMIE